MKELNYKDIALLIMDSIAKEKDLDSCELIHTDTTNHTNAIVFLFSCEVHYVKYFAEVSVAKNDIMCPTVVSYYNDLGDLYYYDITIDKTGKIEVKHYAG